MTGVLAPVIHLLAPWQSLMSDSTAVSTSVTTVHLMSLLFGGGFAVAADRATLRTRLGDGGAAHRQLRHLEAVHRPVLIALAVLVLSGVALAAADLDSFIASPVFYVKLGLVGLLVINGAVLRRTERSLLRLDPNTIDDGRRTRGERLWRRLRRASWCSLVLWAGAVAAGAALTNVA